jgi:hypothetical protein
MSIAGLCCFVVTSAQAGVQGEYRDFRPWVPAFVGTTE